LRRVAIAVLAANLAVASSCGGREPTSERWFAERGERAPTWHACLRLGAALRAACAGDTACAAKVTTDVTRPCYAARYRAATERARPGDDIAPRALSPCFWQRAAGAGVEPAAWAAIECRDLRLPPDIRPHCVAELRAVIEGLCSEGSTELTGAGP
jgi:hypothetical protein